MEGALRRRPGAAGFTLVEVLVAVVIMAIVGVAIAAISLTGVVRISGDNETRQQDAVAAQWVSTVFARDVQGAAGIVAPGCAVSSDPGGSLVDSIALLSSTTGDVIEYRVVGLGPYSLVRVDCAADRHRQIVGELAVKPQFRCGVGACTPPATPRRISISTGRTSSSEFRLDGSRRTLFADDDDPTTPPPSVPPTQLPPFLALGGSEPLLVNGHAVELVINGSAYVNLPENATSGDIVRLDGGPKFTVTGDLALQEGGTCRGCTADFYFPERIPDPLRFLPPPDTTDLPSRTDCEQHPTKDVRVCLPGKYANPFPPTGGPGPGSKDFQLEPGVYALQGGLKATGNGSITGEGVLLYNEAGKIEVRSGYRLDLGPSMHELYKGLLIFQPRENKSEIVINGNAELATLAGTIYAPGSDGVVLGGGTGSLTVGRVVGTNLQVSGNGTVRVNGS